MTGKNQRPRGRDRDSAAGISSSLKRALGQALLPDQTADADFSRMLDRLRGEPGTNGRGQTA